MPSLRCGPACLPMPPWDGGGACRGGPLPLGPVVEAPPKSGQRNRGRRWQRRRDGPPREDSESALEAAAPARDDSPDPIGRTKRSRIASAPPLSHTERVRVGGIQRGTTLTFVIGVCWDSYIRKPNHRGTMLPTCRRAECCPPTPRGRAWPAARAGRRDRSDRRKPPPPPFPSWRGPPVTRCAALSPTLSRSFRPEQELFCNIES